MWRERVSFILISSLAFASMEGRSMRVQIVVAMEYAITEDERLYVLCVVAMEYVLMENARADAPNANG
jgi:hypothetical protein